MCELFLNKKNIYILLHFLFKETKYMDEGRCMCRTYVELNLFPGKEFFIFLKELR